MLGKVLSHRFFALPAIGAMLVLSACSSPQQPAGSQTPANSAPKAKVDRLVFATEPPALETNQTRMLSTPNAWQYTPMYESLLGVNAKDGKREPALATEWKVGDDGMSYVFTLRKGVRFHPETGGVTGDWGEFTANDLVEPFNQINLPDSVSGVTAMWRNGAVKGVEPVDDYHAIIHLTRPDANFIDYVSDQLGGYEIWSTKAFKELGQPEDLSKPMLPGTGPYMYESRAQSQYIRFKRTPYQQWKAVPDFPEFEFRFMKEASTRLATLLTGEAQMATLPQDLEAQAEQRGYKTFTGTTPAYRVFIQYRCCWLKDRKDPQSGWGDPDAPLANAKVRQALSKAIDRDQLNKAFFGNKGKLLVNNPLAAWRQGWNPQWEKDFPQYYGFDKEAARKLLAEAGYGPDHSASIQMVLTTATGLPAADDISDAIGNFWKDAGIDVQYETVDSATFSARSRNYGYTNAARINGTSSNAWVGLTQFGSTAGTPGDAGPQVPETDALIKQLWTTLDDKEVEDIWRRVGDRLFYQDFHFAPLFWLPTEVTGDPKVVGSWQYSGSISGSWTHIWNIKAAK